MVTCYLEGLYRMNARERTLRALAVRNQPLHGRGRRAHRTQARRASNPSPILLLLVFGLGLGTVVTLASCGQVARGTGAAVTQARDVIDRGVAGLPSEGPLDLELPQTATIQARDGTTLAEINDRRFGYRYAVPLSEISPLLPMALFAAEDKNFYKHHGVDPTGILRAVTLNATSEGVASGASTLDMQLARNLFFPDERTEQTLSRKVKEAVAAYQLNQHFSKNEILETYLNTTYFGNLAFGAEAAANRYFGKSAKELNLPEAAMLAGLPQSPSAYDPLRNYEIAKRRQEHVLGLMQELGFISEAENAEASAYELRFNPGASPPAQATHWVNYVQDTIRERLGPDVLFTGGLRMETTIDLEVQRIAEQIVATNESVRQQARANNTAMVVLDPRNGQVLAMVGSKNFNDRSIDGEVNVAVAGRQPGSSIKPLVYLAGFEQGLNPAVEVLDRQIGFSSPPGQPPYVPANYDDKYYGRVTLRDALGNSLNVPAVMVLKYAGVPQFKDLARRMGITTLDDWDRRWLSLTLGGGEVKLLELVGAYATIARGGKYTPVEPFLRVENARGEVLHEAAPDGAGEQVIDPRKNYQILHAMGDPGARLLTFGPNTPLNLPRPHMVKTGTTDDYRDTWTVGCVPQICVGVWMGNTNNAPMVKVSSSLTAGKIWVEMMNAMINRYQLEPIPFERPEGVIVTQVPNVGDARSGARTHEEVFLAGEERRFQLEMDWMRQDP